MCVSGGGGTRRMRHSSAELTVGLRSLLSNGIVKSIADMMTAKMLISSNIHKGKCTSLGL